MMLVRKNNGRIVHVGILAATLTQGIVLRLISSVQSSGSGVNECQVGPEIT